jgi:alpha-ketoglutarate-dependent taurine dioxygenase
VNYAPWLLPATLDDEQRDALSAFQRALTTGTVTRMRLVENQCLFIDNWCMLHGRDPVVADSPRLLKRAWIRSNRQDASQYRVRP